jgi:HK97 family phage major capsid protein
MKTVLALAASAAPRALISGIRADATDPKSMLSALTKAFEDFKAENDQRLKAKADVVVDEKVDRINAEIGNLQAAIDQMAVKLAAGAAGKEPLRDPEYTDQFRAYFKSGVETSRLQEVKAAVTKTDGEGGFLAPVEWDRTVTSRLKEVSQMRRYSNVISISSAGYKKVFSDRSIGSGWVGEKAARPETGTPALAELNFPLGELYANPAATQGIIDDAEVNIEQWLADEVSVEFDRQEGIAFLSGDGTNKPFGILTYVTGAANAARHPWGAIPVVNGGNASALTGDGIINLIYDLPEPYSMGANLFMARSTLAATRRLKDGQGNYLWQPSYQLGQPQTLNGTPVVEMLGMPAVAANAIAMLYGNMQATYQVVDRVGIRVLRDPYTNKPFVHFYTTKRVGGGVYNPEAMRALRVAA